MKILIDVNLSPAWISEFETLGLEALHWSSIGPLNAPDRDIFEFAREKGFIIFTHDLDFGDILAATNAGFPSVIQIRTQDVGPDVISSIVTSAIEQFREHLNDGALITVDKNKVRARILPLRK